MPAKITVSGLQRVLQNLLAEQISVRDLPTILEGIAEAVGYTQNLVIITEHVRGRLARQISYAHSRSGFIPLVTLSPMWEQRFSDSLLGNGDEKQLAMAPSLLQEFIAAIRDAFEKYAGGGDIPCLLTSPGIRPYVRSIVERFRPATVVLSQAEIHPRAKIRALGQV
jgi:flagellar biosynthesis protein FlhA